jgi:SAM-dependent methyltransferase
MTTDDTEHVLEHYVPGLETDRLGSPLGTIEFERTKEELSRYLPPPPATVADIGGGPGAYALWLAQAGYSVIHRDLVPGHVEELRRAASALGLTIDADVGDARDLDLVDDSADAVLLLGPLYHLTERADRLRTLEEVRRILRMSGVAFIAAISRWAARLHGVVVQRLYQEFRSIGEELERVEATGKLPPLFPGSFAGFCHRPDQLRGEIADAGLDLVDLVSLEGIAFALSDLEDRLASAEDREVVLEAARRLGRVAELLGLGPHLLAIARHLEPGVR